MEQHARMALSYGKAKDEAELAAFGQLVSTSFGFPAENYPEWFERAGHDNKTERCDERPARGLRTAPILWLGRLAGAAVRPG